MNDEEYGSRPYRGWSPERLLDLKQQPKKKRKDVRAREALNQLFEEPPKDETKHD